MQPERVADDFTCLVPQDMSDFTKRLNEWSVVQFEDFRTEINHLFPVCFAQVCQRMVENVPPTLAKLIYQMRPSL